MNLDADIQKLEQQRDQEISLIRSRITTLANTLEHDASPARWIGKHPYIATASAAMAGFVVAQIPIGSIVAAARTAWATPHPPAATPPAALSPPAAPTVTPPTPPPGIPWGDILDVAVNFAQQFLKPQADSPPASLTIANAGAVEGSTFPQMFAHKSEEPSETGGS